MGATADTTGAGLLVSELSARPSGVSGVRVSSDALCSHEKGAVLMALTTTLSTSQLHEIVRHSAWLGFLTRWLKSFPYTAKIGDFRQWS